MRIGLVISSNYYKEGRDDIPNGVVVYVKGLSSALIRKGHSVTIISRSSGGPSHGVTDMHWEYEGAEVVSLACDSSNFHFSERVHGFLLQKQLDVVESHQVDHPLIIEQLYGGTPTVVRCASGFFDSLAGGVFSFGNGDTPSDKNFYWTKYLAECDSIRMANCVLCAGKKSLLDAGKFNDRLLEIPLGLDRLGQYTEGEAETLETKTVLIPVGRFFDPRKGGEIVPSIIKNIPSRYDVVVCGENPDKKLEEEILSFGDRVTLEKNAMTRSDFYSLYRKSDFVFCPTKNESFGYMLIEPMYFGKPVICFDQPDISKREWPLSFVGPWGDEESLSRIPAAISEAENYYESNAYELKRFAEKFYWDNIIDSYVDAYNKAIAHSVLSGRIRGW